MARRVLDAIVKPFAPPNELNPTVLLHKSRVEQWRACEHLLFWRGVSNVFISPLKGVPQLAAAAAFDVTAGMLFPGGLLYFGKAMEEAGRRLWLHVITTFPADVIARCYAVTPHVARGMRGYAATTETVHHVQRGNPDERYEPQPTWHSLHLFIDHHLQKYGEY